MVVQEDSCLDGFQMSLGNGFVSVYNKQLDSCMCCIFRLKESIVYYYIFFVKSLVYSQINICIYIHICIHIYICM